MSINRFQYKFTNSVKVYLNVLLLKKYLLTDPKDTSALILLAKSYQNVNQIDSAVKYYDIASLYGVKYNSDMAEAHAILGNYDKAIEVYKFLIDNNKTKLADARLYGFNNRKKFVICALLFPTRFAT